MEVLPLNWIQTGLLVVTVVLVALVPPADAAPLHQEEDPQTQTDAFFLEGFNLIKNGEFQKALSKFEAALPLYEAADEREWVGWCLTGIGYAKHELADYPGALEAYQGSLPIWQQLGKEAERGLALNNIGEVYRALGRYQQALEHYRQALAIAQDIGDRAGEGTALNNIGITYTRLGQYQQALDHYQRALAITQDIDNRAWEARTLNNIGEVYRALGQYRQALEFYRQALAITQDIGDRVGEAAVLNSLGVIYCALGRYQRALGYLQQSLVIHQQFGARAKEGTLLSNLGEVYRTLGQYEQSLEFYQQALAIAQDIGDRVGEGTVLNNLGTVYIDLEQYQLALDHYQQALALAADIGDLAASGTTLNNIAGVYTHVGQYRQALEFYQQASTIAQNIGNRAGLGTKLNNIGEIYRILRQFDEALNYYEQALAIAEETGDTAGEWTRLHNIGVLYEQQGDLAQAITHYQRAIEVVESVQGAISVEELKVSFAGEQTDTYKRLINLLWQGDRFEDAFDYVERARARAFLDQIGNQRVDFRQDAAPELIEQEQALRQRIIGLQSTVHAERSKPFDQQSQQLLERLSVELEGARSDHKEFMTRLKLASPEYASLVSVSTLSLEDVQNEVLDENTTLIEYFILDDRTLAWVVDQAGFQLVASEISRDELQNQVEFLRDLIDAREFDPQLAANLYDALFAPLKPHIRHPNLVIVPHGVLHYLPFTALWDAETDRHLVEDYALTYAPSASALKFILDKRSPDEGRLLAMGNPDGSLPHAEAEAAAIAGLYDTAPLLGGEATESQVYAQAGELDLLHLAAHGVYNPFNPMFTRIELAPDDAADGNLEVHEVFGLDLTGANLVVLSACHTALGEQSEGDELVGLTRAFLYAGTPAVVTTLWSVDDAASSALMDAFYRQLRAGLTNAEASRAAQITVMAEEEWREPYYWAAFSLTGDYRGSGEPGMVTANTPERTQAASVVETPSSMPAVEPSPTPGAGRHGLCAAVALPGGLVALAGLQWRRKTARGWP